MRSLPKKSVAEEDRDAEDLYGQDALLLAAVAGAASAVAEHPDGLQIFPMLVFGYITGNFYDQGIKEKKKKDALYEFHSIIPRSFPIVGLL